MKIILLIGIGSFIGGISRYLLSLFIQNKFLSTFPFGTLGVNIMACFLIGIVFGLSERGNFNMEWRLFLATGFLGGFSTFSSFSMETVGLLRDGQMWQAFTYIMSSMVICLLATFIGISLIKLL
ncbi:fluoride efflux transporter CrcB [Ginsengibacter hankyongi]|uniref:Fluoride-specific ion channel FluC n=1 Tax=Ginsengibacter hankyongi TaxID=2607284 RepID=A0A5J5IDR7_9BACT|nr:fluoride efflux transporter CrcB [Ginsengibacter hankyongi]KAA9037661.1 fluoride efflux transporter CrcB [Ginsengibacter hankyongi]